jgi:hypothetical protein
VAAAYTRSDFWRRYGSGDLAKQLTSKQSLVKPDRDKKYITTTRSHPQGFVVFRISLSSPPICAVGFGYVMHARDTKIDHQATSCSDEFQCDRSVCRFVYDTCMNLLANMLSFVHRLDSWTKISDRTSPATRAVGCKQRYFILQVERIRSISNTSAG